MQTCFKDIKQIPPGHYLKLDVKTLQIKIKRYWDIVPDNQFSKMREPDAQVYFRELLTNSIIFIQSIIKTYNLYYEKTK